MSIAAVMFVYNEEARIEETLKCLPWCDEIIVVDRNSTDRTREIARKYTDKVVLLDDREFDPSDSEVALAEVKSEWVLTVTASDLISPELAERLRALTSKEDFPYDIIQIPFRRYVLGLETRRSPWYSGLNPYICYRKSVASIRKDSVHGALMLNSGRHYKVPESDRHCMYHLTHSSMDMLMDRHLVYCRAEGRIFPKERPLSRAALDILRAVYVVLIKRRTFLMGRDGVALMMAYLSYWMLRFVYIWERRACRAPETYEKIKKEIALEWEKHSPK